MSGLSLMGLTSAQEQYEPRGTMRVLKFSPLIAMCFPAYGLKYVLKNPRNLDYRSGKETG